LPTAGSVSSPFTNGADQSETETATLSNVGGDATLTDASGQTSSIVLQHCL
jgi:hypothetical protein